MAAVRRLLPARLEGQRARRAGESGRGRGRWRVEARDTPLPLEQEYFADGVVEEMEIISACRASPWLFGVARNSTLTYKAIDPELVGRELGVRCVLRI